MATAHGSEESEGEERRGGADDGIEAAEFLAGGDPPEPATVELGRGAAGRKGSWRCRCPTRRRRP